MTARTSPRLIVFAVLIAALIAVLLGRAAQLQTGAAADYQLAAEENRTRTTMDPAPRGLILDQAGRALAANHSVLQIVVDRTNLYELPADGADVVQRLADLLGTTFEDIDARLTPCASENAQPGLCWNGLSYEPIPVADDVTPLQALAVLEQPESYPAVATRTVTTRTYPGEAGVRAGHLLGHLGPVTEEELAAADGLTRVDQVGRSGLEQQYDEVLRGSNGSRTLNIDTAGRVTSTQSETLPVAGATVVTSIDAQLQAVVERELLAAVERARANTERELAADTAAAVVVDVTDGRVLAMASYPDYDPEIWLGGISQADYEGLLDSGALLFNPVQGLYAPGSTFKPLTVAAMATQGYNLNGSYPCPSTYSAGGRSFSNFESQGYGTISLQRAIEVSCNTVFYRTADEIWATTGGQDAGPQTRDPIYEAATGFGLGSATGIDLPAERGGAVAGRSTKHQQWLDRREAWCAAAEQGYPELRQTDPALADEYTALDAENCESGGLWRQGDALNASIGQGITAVTPLQMAMAYAAIANGGTLYRPTVGKAIIGADGTVTEIQSEEVGQVPADAATLDFLRRSMVGVTESGSGSAPFAGFPLDEVAVASKTGSAQVSGGRPSTSWFASFAPAEAPRYAVIMMVTQGGTGSGTSGPGVRAIYEAIFGIEGGSVDPARSVLVGGAPMAGLPEGVS